LSRGTRRGADHGAAGRRRHPDHGLHRGSAAAPRPHLVQCVERLGDHRHQIDGGGTGAEEHPRQLPLPGCRRDRHAGEIHGRRHTRNPREVPRIDPARPALDAARHRQRRTLAGLGRSRLHHRRGAGGRRRTLHLNAWVAGQDLIRCNTRTSAISRQSRINPANNETYTYTANGFIENADGPWGSLTYTIDGVGNITQRTVTIGGVTSIDTYSLQGGSNRLTGILTGGAPSRGFQSDLAGNVTQDATVSPELTKTYSYNAAGQLSGATTNGTTAGAYIYDYLSRLVSRTIAASSATLHMVHDLDGNVIAEYDASGALVTEYIWVEGRPLAMVADAGITPVLYYVLTDHLERPVMMTDQGRNVVWQASYLPYGEVRSISGTATLNQRFPGQ
ncbi:RHS repeat protein, partial [Mesorhizobium sp. M7A.F.Ca.CA.003.01.2.1]